MNGSSKHTLYGVIFIAACLLVAGILYAVVRSPAPTEVIENTSVDDLRVDLPEANSTPEANGNNSTVSTPTLQDASTDSSVQPGRCGMEECSWSKALSRDVIQADQRGRLIEVTLLGGSSRSEKSRITWNDRPHDVYVFCSTALPTVMMEADGRWQVDVLDFIDGIPGVLETSAAIYGEFCHAGDSRFPTDAEALGYAHIDDEKEDIQVERPTDIFAVASPSRGSSGL
jgi:hypothetical protein